MPAKHVCLPSHLAYKSPPNQPDGKPGHHTRRGHLGKLNAKPGERDARVWHNPGTYRTDSANPTDRGGRQGPKLCRPPPLASSFPRRWTSCTSNRRPSRKWKSNPHAGFPTRPQRTPGNHVAQRIQPGVTAAAVTPAVAQGKAPHLHVAYPARLPDQPGLHTRRLNLTSAYPSWPATPQGSLPGPRQSGRKPFKPSAQGAPLLDGTRPANGGATARA